MPQYYEFHDTSGTAIPLNVVDDMIRQDLGLPLDPDHYCEVFNVIRYSCGVSLQRADWNLTDLEWSILQKYLPMFHTWHSRIK